MYHNPEYFKDPTTFRPERFLDADGKFNLDERVIYFGTGKRRCVGEILGRAEAYLFAASMLQAFKFAPADGEKIDITKYHPGLNMHTVPFRASIKPRY